MLKYAKIIDETTKMVSVAVSTTPDIPYFTSRGFTLQDVEQAYNGAWYAKGYAPMRPEKEIIQDEISILKEELRSLDYIGVKIATGRATTEEYAAQIAKMTEYANKINELEAKLEG